MSPLPEYGDDIPERQPSWMSILELVKWIDNQGRKAQDAWDNPAFDARVFFENVDKLHDALCDDKLVAYGSFDTEPIAIIPAVMWSTIDFAVIWDEDAFAMRLNCNIWPTDILARSQTSFPARLVKNRLEWCGLPGPQTGSDDDTKHYYRFFTELVFKRDAVVALWTVKQASTPPTGRKKRELSLKVDECLGFLKRKGVALANSPGDASMSQIAKQLIQYWIDLGDNTFREEATVKKSVERYYKRKAAETAAE